MEQNKKYALFVGRWQPFHEGHKYLVDKVLSEGKDVCIAIRDTEISEKDPYTVWQREEMIKRVYGNKVKIITVPDIESINIGRQVGYEVNRIDAPEEITKISGTNVRNGLEVRIPREVAEYIKLLKTPIWFTGLPCSGKTTLAKKLKEEFDIGGFKSIHLDADEIREKLNKDLGYSEKDRHENLRRVACMAKLLKEKGNLVITSFITPNDIMRNMVRETLGEVCVVYLKCSLETCEKRDVKGMYKKARQGEIKEFTGVTSLFEEPKNPDIVIDTENNDVEACVNIILKRLKDA